jgi:hypothetical protein
MKVGVSREEATDDSGSVGACCEIEVEIAGGTADAEIMRIRDHWLGLCEVTVEEELCRLRGGQSGSTPASAPPARPAAAKAKAVRPDYRAAAQARVRREDPEENGELDDDEENPPTNGRQLLGWAAKQDPDAKGLVISFGKKRGYPSKIVDWADDQVRVAYRYARGRQVR